MKRRSVISLSLFTILSAVIFLDSAAADTVTVRTKYGDIEGTAMAAPPMPGSAVTKVSTFLGIPFAAPPVGELRFQPPKPATAWKPKVYKATQFGKVCIQQTGFLDAALKTMFPNFGKGNYSEDCLYLNVFAPTQNDSLNPLKQYPVMVYIHGGGFIVGSAILSPGLVLPTYGVVLVTIQYRLGPFGFLSTGDSTVRGNYGMLDQVQALKWVKENIRDFGGDPNKVTIFGLSAGGASVGLQLVSPLSKGLVHGAISESGVDLAPWSSTTPDVARHRTVELAKTMNCETDESDKLVECIRKKDAWEISNKAGLYWVPVVDSVAGANAFLPKTPKNLRQDGDFNKVPYMVGFTSNEGAYFAPHLVNVTVDSAFFEKAMKNYVKEGQILVTKNKQQTVMMQNALEFQYTPWGEIADPLKLRQGIVDVRSDEWFVASSVQVCKAHSKYVPRTYLFEFDYRSNNSINAIWMGSTHGENFIFGFGVPFVGIPGQQAYNAADKNVSHFMMKMYTDFAKLGDPTPEPLSNGVQWIAFNSTNQAYLHFDISPEMRKNYKPRRISFWNDYVPNLMKSALSCKPEAKDGAMQAFGPFPGLTIAFAIGTLFFTLN